MAEAFFMPTMTDGTGADWIGGWFGTGPERGIALIFTLAGIIGVAVTLAARATARTAASPPPDLPPHHLGGFRLRAASVSAPETDAAQKASSRGHRRLWTGVLDGNQAEWPG